MHAKTIAVLFAVAGCRRDHRPVDSRAPEPAAAHGERTTAGQELAASRTDSTPAGVVRDYYALIEARRYDSAYAIWGDAGQASGKSPREFAAGFSETARVAVTVTDSTRVEGAAGSQYATVPVRVDAVLRDGREQHFSGSYTLRRSLVDGATPEQRRWTIYRARLAER